MYIWLWLAISSGIIIGFCDIFKKKAMEKSSVLDVLALYSLFCFILVSFEFKNALNVDKSALLLVLLKSSVLIVAWISGFIAINKMPISVIIPFKTLTPLFSIIFGIFILGESLGILQYTGITIMMISYYYIGKSGQMETQGLFKNKYFKYMVLCSFLNAVSALLDKIILKSINTGQLQFWFSLFMTVMYFMIIGITKLKDKDKTPIKFNYFIVLMAMTLVIADRLYFKALEIPEGRLSIILPLRFISVIISALVGGMMFREKNLMRKIVFISILILGVILVMLGK